LLFAKPDPDVSNFAAELNLNSLEVLTDVKVEPALAGGNDPAAVQFERMGYFARDKDSTPGRPVFNRTVGLRDTWGKVQARGVMGGGPRTQRACRAASRRRRPRGTLKTSCASRWRRCVLQR
jgi:hypothetical protein